jgi:hypothetical protein
MVTITDNKPTLNAVFYDKPFLKTKTKGRVDSMPKIILVLSGIFLGCAFSAPAQVAGYDFVSLDYPGHYDDTHPVDIDSGTIVGVSNDEDDWNGSLYYSRNWTTIKSAAIEKATKKRATMLWNGIAETLEANPNMQTKDALIAYMEAVSMEEFLYPVSPADRSLSDIFSEFVSKAEQEGELLWHELFFQWTAQLVLMNFPTMPVSERKRI